MDNEFRLTSREYAAILGIQPEALRSRRRRGLENGNFKEIDKKFWWKTPLGDRPFIVDDRDDSRSIRVPRSLSPAARKRRRGTLIKGLKTNYHNARNGWQLEEHNLVKHLAKIRYEKGDKIVDEITPEVIKIAKKNLDEKIQKEAEKTLTKNPYGLDPGPGIPYGIDRTDPKYGSMLNAKGLQKIDDDYHRRKSYLDNYRSDYGSRSNSLFFGNFGQSDREEKGSVEIDPNNFTPDDRTPEFKNKIEEEIWRLKNRK
jgi:hypothetical protein